MAGETLITVTGNLTADPDLQFTNSGAPWCRFTIASTPSRMDRATGQWVNGDTLFMNCTAWNELAENINESLTKGAAVVAQGNLQQRSYQAQDGTNRTVIDLRVTDIGPSLRRASASVTKKAPTGGNGNAGGFAPSTPASSTPTNTSVGNDPWEVDEMTDPSDLPF